MAKPIPTPIPNDVKARFWAKVDVRGPDECWEWKGYRLHRGYGRLGTKLATHLSLTIAGKPRPGGAWALHSCDNPACVNPAHLRWGDRAQNIADMMARGRHTKTNLTTCPQGHPYSSDNLYITRRGWRECRICRRQNYAAFERKNGPRSGHKPARSHIDVTLTNGDG